jgi:putative hemolysin
VDLGGELLIILALVLLNGFFSGAEIALLSVRKTRLAELARGGKSSARWALGLRENPERLLATVQVGITVIGATAAAFGGSSLQDPLMKWLDALGVGEYSEGLALALVVGWISALSIVLGELVPKSLALRASERFSLMVSAPLTFVALLARPVVWALTLASNLVLRPFRDQTTFSEARLSPEELQQLVEEAAATGAVHPGAGDIASRAIDLSGIRIAAIFVPRSEMVVIPMAASQEQVVKILKDDPHSRYPVVGETPEDIRGYVLAIELYHQLLQSGTLDLSLALRPVRFMVESRRAVDALHEMRESRTPMALVVDEHGGVAGLVTVRDITEELVGDVLSEHEPEELRIQKEDEQRFVIIAVTPLHEVNRELGVQLPEGPGYTTLGGLVVQSAGRMVRTGERVQLPMEITAEVLDATARQVRVVRLHLPSASDATDA